MAEFITHLFGTTLLTLLPVLFARLAERGLFFDPQHTPCRIRRFCQPHYFA
ncbi:hypothetical protein NCT57_000994 [Salmonella enterica]|nr:hypothetical protein [Salmonella enterica]